MDGNHLTKDGKLKMKRLHDASKRKIEVRKLIRRLVSLGYDYRDIQEELQKRGYRYRDATVKKMMWEIRQELLSMEEAWRIIVERIEKKKFIEREALKNYKRALETDDIKEINRALRLLKEVSREVEDFLSRFNLMPAIPIRQEVDVIPKIDFFQLIDQVEKGIQEEVETSQQKEGN